MKRFVSIITVVMFMLVFVLAGCGQTAPVAEKGADSTKAEATKAADTKADASKADEKKFKDPKDVVIGFCTPITTHPAWIPVKEGSAQAAKDFGFKALWNGANMCEIPQMLETMETYLAQKVDGLVVYPLSGSAFTPVLEKYKAANIPVVTFGGDAEKKEQRLGFVGTDNAAAGKIHADALHKFLGKDAMKIGILMSGLDAQNQMTQVKSLEEYIKPLKDAAIIDKRDNKGGGDNAVTLDVISAMLKAHPDINCIFETDGGGAGTVGKVIKEQNLVGKVFEIGYDDAPDSIAALKEGTVAGLMVQNFYNWGYIPTKYAFMATQGKAKDIPDFTDAGVLLVTKDNVATYKDILYGKK